MFDMPELWKEILTAATCLSTLTSANSSDCIRHLLILYPMVFRATSTQISIPAEVGKAIFTAISMEGILSHNTRRKRVAACWIRRSMLWV